MMKLSVLSISCWDSDKQKPRKCSQRMLSKFLKFFLNPLMSKDCTILLLANFSHDLFSSDLIFSSFRKSWLERLTTCSYWSVSG